MKLFIPKKQITLVNRDFQLRYAKLIFFLGLLTSCITAFVILYPLYEFEVLKVPRFLPLPILAFMLLTLVINVGVLFFVVILITHRMAGPMHRLFRDIRQIGLGNYCVEISWRPEDEFHYVLRNFNEMAHQLKSTTAYDLALVEQAVNGIQQNKATEDILAQLEQLKSRLESRIDESRNASSMAALV